MNNIYDEEKKIINNKERILRIRKRQKGVGGAVSRGGSNSHKNHEVKHAVEHTTKELLNNIFGNTTPKNPNKADGIILNNTYNNIPKPQPPPVRRRRQRTYDDDDGELKYQSFGPSSFKSKTSEEEQEKQKENENEKDQLLKHLINDKDHAIKQNTIQGEKTIEVLQDMIREERNSFEELTHTLQEEKEKTINQIVESSNAKIENMEKQFQQTANVLLKTMQDDRAAFTNSTQKAFEDKQISGQMLRDTLSQSNDSLNSTLKVFLNRQFEDLVQDKNDTITKMQSQIETLTQELRKTSEEQLTGSFVNYHLEHAKKFDNTLQLISSLEHRRNANIKGIEASLQSAVLNSINERMISIHQIILQQTERLSTELDQMNLTSTALTNMETSMQRQIKNISFFAHQLDSFDFEKYENVYKKMNEFNAAFDDKFLQLNNRVDKTLDAFLNALFRKLTAINERIAVATNQTSEYSAFITSNMSNIRNALGPAAMGANYNARAILSSAQSSDTN